MDIQIFYTKEGDVISKYPEIELLLRDDDMKDSFIEKRIIKMVGSYMFANGTIWYSFPKYYPLLDYNTPSPLDRENLNTIIKVLEKLRSEGRNLFDGDHVFAENAKKKVRKKVNILSLSKFIVKDYLQHGLYKKSEKRYFKSGKGRDVWSKTVKRDIPFFDEDTPMYFTPWRSRYISDDNNCITDLHSFIVNQAIEVYNKFDRKISVKSQECKYIYSSEDLKSFSNMLRQEMLTVFSDRELSLFKALIAWCDMSYNYKLAGCTNCFQNVWEWVNDAVFGNQRGSANKESEQPMYHFQGDSPYVGKGQAKPDTIFFDVKKGEQFLFVYDSKYYIPSFNAEKHEIYGAPANSDIVKQVAYLKNISKCLVDRCDNLKTKNVFLLPEIEQDELDKINQFKVSDELYMEIGYVEQANFNEMASNLLKSVDIEIEIAPEPDKNDRVYLYMVYCTRLFDMYLKNKSYIPKEITDV